MTKMMDASASDTSTSTSEVAFRRNWGFLRKLVIIGCSFAFRRRQMFKTVRQDAAGSEGRDAAGSVGVVLRCSKLGLGGVLFMVAGLGG